MSEASLTVAAAENYVSYQLAMLGYIPISVRHRLPWADLLVATPESSNVAAVLVRAAANAAEESTEGHPGAMLLRFPLRHRDLSPAVDNSIFCFVDLRRHSGGAPSDVYVLSAATLRRIAPKKNRPYSPLHYENSWSALQPFRNDWSPILQAVNSPNAAAPAVLASARAVSGLT